MRTLAAPLPRIQFVYLATEPGAAPFEHFLREAPLLRALPAWTVLVVQPSHVSATTLWETTFRRVVDTLVRLGSDAAQALERYFIARRAVERNDFAKVTVSDLQGFRSAKLRFAEPAIDTLYRTWAATEQDRVEPALLLGVLPRTGQLVIRTLPYRYEQLGAFAGVL